MIYSQAELREHPVADKVGDEFCDVTVRAPGLHLLLLGHEVAKVGNPGSDGQPDAVHEGGDGGERPSDDRVKRQDYGAQR